MWGGFLALGLFPCCSDISLDSSSEPPAFIRFGSLFNTKAICMIDCEAQYCFMYSDFVSFAQFPLLLKLFLQDFVVMRFA